MPKVHSFPCPFCRSTRTRQTGTRLVPRVGLPYRRRNKVCLSCERPFTTYELVGEPEALRKRPKLRRPPRKPRAQPDLEHLPY